MLPQSMSMSMSARVIATAVHVWDSVHGTEIGTAGDLTVERYEENQLPAS